VEERDVFHMTACMINEPFYSSGKYVNNFLGLSIGWVCHTGSFSDCMPVWNETKDVCLIFYGEDFNDATEIEDLRRRGHHFGTNNASYLVHLYEETGPQFIEKMNGSFSAVLVDLRDQRVLLFNDRYGLGRIYYFENRDGFYFSSEAKSLLKILPELRRLDMTSLGETFLCGCVMQNRSLFCGVSLLPGASLWTFSKERQAKREIYFNKWTWEKQPVLSAQKYYQKLKETFTRILPRYFRGSEQVGMSLTGGLDGRLIMAWANRPRGSLPCYTFGSNYRDPTDVKIARRIARLFEQPHQTIVVGSDFFDDFPLLAEKAVFVSDGTMDVTGSVELYVNRIARQIAPVRLTGNYGSEILRGNIAFKPGYLYENVLAPEFATFVRNANGAYEKERQGHRQSFIAFKQVPWHHYSRHSVEQSQLTVRSPYLDNDLVSQTYQAPPEVILSREPSLRLIAEGKAGLAEIPTDRGIVYRSTPVIGRIQNQYQEITVKAEYAYDYGMPQWLSRIDHLLAALH